MDEDLPRRDRYLIAGTRMRGRYVFSLFSPVISLAAAASSLLPAWITSALLVGARPIPGLVGMGARYILLRSIAESVGSNVSLRETVFVKGASRLRLGKNVSIHPMCYVDASGGISIGDNVSVAHGTTIMSTSHNFDSYDTPINDQGVSFSPTVIEDNCWIGAQSVIVAGVRIGAGSVVGANSVVTSDVPSESIVAGSPARVVRRRTGST